MAKVVSPLTVRVEVIGKPKESSYQPNTFYYRTLFIDLSKPEGSEAAKIWKSLSSDEVSQIVKGDVVQLVPAGIGESGKTKHNIVITQPAASHGNKRGEDSARFCQSQVSKDYRDRTIGKTETVSEIVRNAGSSAIARSSDDSGLISADQKRAIAAFIDSQADLYRFCYLTAQSKLDGVTDDLEVTRCMATKLYLGAVRKFGLDK
jgi:hypothetical protein